MKINKKYLTVLIIIVVISIISCLFLSKLIQESNQKLTLLQENQQRIINLNTLSNYLNDSCIALGNYISKGELKYLESYQRFSYQAEKYRPINMDNNKNIKEFMEIYHSYLSFVETKVLISSSDSLNKDDLYRINEEYANKLADQLKLVLTSYQQEDNAISTELKVKNNQVKSTLFLMAISSLLVFPTVLYLMLKPALKKGLYLEYCFSDTDASLLFINNSGFVKDLNKSAENLFEIFPESILDKNIERFPEQFPHLQRISQPLFHTLLYEEEQLNVRVIIYKDARPVELSVDYIPIFFLNRLMGALLIARPTNNLKDKPLLLDTLEKERKRISIEIHDWIARYMSTIIHSLDYTLRLNKNGDLKGEDLLHRLSELRNHCQNAAIEMRGIMNDIHPYLIDKVGLISALESYIITFEKLNKVKVFIFYHDRSLRIKKKDQIIIYRIIQEALSNIVKHAQATEVDINFTLENDILRIEVMDNGNTQEDFVIGKGLWGMKERAGLIGAEIDFGHCETGFCVTLTVPIVARGDADGENQNHVD